MSQKNIEFGKIEDITSMQDWDTCLKDEFRSKEKD